MNTFSGDMEYFIQFVLKGILKYLCDIVHPDGKLILKNYAWKRKHWLVAGKFQLDLRSTGPNVPSYANV